MMTQKTLADCAKCLAKPHCSAFEPEGEWKHDKGIDPCVVVIEPDSIEMGFL